MLTFGTFLTEFKFSRNAKNENKCFALCNFYSINKEIREIFKPSDVMHYLKFASNNILTQSSIDNS